MIEAVSRHRHDCAGVTGGDRRVGSLRRPVISAPAPGRCAPIRSTSAPTARSTSTTSTTPTTTKTTRSSAPRSRGIATTATTCSRPSRIAIWWSSRSARTAAPRASTTPGPPCSARSAATATTSRCHDKATGSAIDPGGRDLLARPLRSPLHPAARLGDARSKLRGKIHITSGTMDNGY
jgi:hypothetical protein